MKSKVNRTVSQLEPTKSELEILQVLWEHGPSTVRFVNEQLNESKREVQYASTLKLMQIMAEKGTLNRDDSQGKHIYHAAIEEEKTKSVLLNRFVDALYNGSAKSLMVQLLGNRKASADDLAEMQNILDEMKKQIPHK